MTSYCKVLWVYLNLIVVWDSIRKARDALKYQGPFSVYRYSTKCVVYSFLTGFQIAIRVCLRKVAPFWTKVGALVKSLLFLFQHTFLLVTYRSHTIPVLLGNYEGHWRLMLGLKPNYAYYTIYKRWFSPTDTPNNNQFSSCPPFMGRTSQNSPQNPQKTNPPKPHMGMGQNPGT